MFTGVSSGGWIGEGAVIKAEVRRYDIDAMRDSRLLNVPSTTVRWLLATSLEFNHAMLAQLNERLSQYISMVETDRMVDPTRAWHARSRCCSTRFSTRTGLLRCRCRSRSWANSSA